MPVSIRPLVEADAATSVGWRNDPSIWRLTASSPTREITLADEVDWVRAVTSRADERRYAIESDGVYVGNIYLTGIADDSAEYHVFIGDRRYLGRGIARAASQLLLGVAREELHLRSVRLSVKAHNERAVKLYGGLGFVPVDTHDGTIEMEVIL